MCAKLPTTEYSWHSNRPRFQHVDFARNFAAAHVSHALENLSQWTVPRLSRHTSPASFEGSHDVAFVKDEADPLGASSHEHVQHLHSGTALKQTDSNCMGTACELSC